VNFFWRCLEAPDRSPSDRVQPANHRHGMANDVVKK
jgi:hypothetical protein